MGKKGKGRGKGKSQDDFYQGQRGQGAQGQPLDDSSKGRGKGKSQDDSCQGQRGQGAQGQPSEESSKGRGLDKMHDDSSKGVEQDPKWETQAPPAEEASRGKKQEISQDNFSRSTGQAQRREVQVSATAAPKGRGQEKSQDEFCRGTGQVQEAQVPPTEAPRGRGRGRGRGNPLRAQEPPSVGRQGAYYVPKETIRSPVPSFCSQPSQTAKGEESPVLSASAVATPEPAKVVPQVLNKNEEQVLLTQRTGLSFEHKSLVKEKKYTMAERPDFGKSGQTVGLYVNYFKLNFKDTSIYHYDVDISDARKSHTIEESLKSKGRTTKQKHEEKYVERQTRRNIGKAKCRQVISEMIKSKTLQKFCPVYDGQKNLFTSHPLPYKEKISFPVDVAIEGKVQKFFVTIQPVDKSGDKAKGKSKGGQSNEIDLQPLIDLYAGRSSEIPLDVLLVYETVMNHREPPLHQVQFRNSFFSLTGDNVRPLGCGLEIWFGYHQSVHLTQLGPVVVINVAAKAFHMAGPVINYANDVLKADITRLHKLQHYQIDMLTQALKGVQVKVMHQRHPRKYKIKTLTEQSANELTFSEGNKKVSVAQYFQQRYGTRLRYPHLPCLQMQTNNNTTFMPMETCNVVEGQPKIGKLSGDLTSKMLKSTAVAPEDRFATISKTALEVKDISKNYMGAFGLIMNVNLLKVDGRLIPAPILSYSKNQDGKSQIARPDNRGVWRIEDGKKFYKVVTINNWVLISFADERYYDDKVLSKYCDLLMRSGNKCGMRMGPVNSITIYGRNVTAEKAIVEAKRSGARFAVVVLNRRDNRHSYDEVKFLSDFKHNLVTQCMEDKTVARITDPRATNDQITTNVCLKINVKLGGINHLLLHQPQIFSKSVMVIGADVIHWTRGYGYPSIVSVVASLDETASRYGLFCDTMRNKKSGKISQEIIKCEKMQLITEHFINRYIAENKGIIPDKIIVFRDGVSEGQFKYALEEEVRGIQEACINLLKHYVPVTFIVVQKRHQTRFLPRDLARRTGRGAKNNVSPGTTVDKDITHPIFFDYFIVSHEGIQGTSKPAHYTVLHDDNKFQSDELQQLCYFLCHTYVRCTRSVSLPAPVLYADLAAFRAKKYADLFTSLDDVSTFSSEYVEREFPPHVQKAITSMKSFENNMFYI